MEENKFTLLKIASSFIALVTRMNRWFLTNVFIRRLPSCPGELV